MSANQAIVTVAQHILQEQFRFPEASGEFSFLLSALTLSTKMIQAKVRKAGLVGILGAAGQANVHGETQQKLDVYANETLLDALSCRETVAVVASEEDEEPIILKHRGQQARYAVVFDPLDGSSNIDTGASVGTIFSIFRKPKRSDVKDCEEWLLQNGRQQVAAGYVLYGSSTVLVYTAGCGVHCFTLDPSVGAYVLSRQNIRMPDQGPYYSVNEANSSHFPPRYQRYLERLRSSELGLYSSRYIGALVADFHRTLLKGGVFLYPPTFRHPKGKLRLLYEADPIALLAEQAGGIATDGNRNILDIEPTDIHQRVPLVVGGRVEMEAFLNTPE